jgi:type I restriction enzyme S subunit
MVVEKGYKQTEVGVIPEDWQLLKILEIAEFKKELFDDGDWIESEYIVNKGIRLIQTGNIGIGKYLEKGNKKYISHSSFIKLKCKELRLGDLLICRLAEPAGRACILKNIEDQKIITSVDVSIFRPDEHKYNREFLNQFFTSKQWLESVSENSGGTTHKRISRGTLGKLFAPIPPLPEQTAIANALSDMDALIAQTEKFIEKKKAIKQGVMQELLKPKEGWVTKKLGEVAEVVGGGTPSTNVSSYWNGEIEWFTPTEVGHTKYLTQSKRKITKAGQSASSAKILPKGSILLTTRAGIGDLGILQVEACTNQGFQSLIAKQGYENEFLYYLVSTKKSDLLQNASGSTFLEISPQKLKSIELSVPDFMEQIRISKILAEIDKLIVLAETKLQKLKLQKQGMMQALLTGIIRLI